MDLQQQRLLFDILQFLLTGGIGIYVYISNKQRVTNERMTAMEHANNKRMASMESDIDDRLDQHGQRLASMEATVKHQPTNQDIAHLTEMVSGLSAQVSGLASNVNGVHNLLAPMQESIGRINDYLLNNKL